MTVGLSAGYRQRPVDPAQDLDAVVALFDAADMADVGFVDPSRDVLRDDWVGPRMDPSHDTALVLTSDGAVAGYAAIEAIHAREAQDAFLRVHPDHRETGVGAALLAWAEARARERLEPGDRCHFAPNIAATDERSVQDLAAAGYEQVRTFWHMERRVTAGLAEPELPPGIEFRPYREERDGRELHRVIEASFAEHFGWEPTSYQEYRALEMDGPSWDPTLVTFAVADGAIAGVVTATRNGDIGWIGDLGVMPQQRGRGIGAALLGLAFAQLAARGLTAVRLNVDAGNETGATRLYERVGMRVRRAWLMYEKGLIAD